MRTRWFPMIVGAVLVSSLSCKSSGGGAASAAASNPPPQVATLGFGARHVRLDYEVTVADIPAGTKELRIWVPMPRRDDHQDIVSAACSGSGAVVSEHADASGNNRLWHAVIANPGTTATVKASMDVVRREQRNNDFRSVGTAPLTAGQQQELAAWLNADSLVPTDGKMKTVATSIAPEEKNPVNLARGLYDHVLGHMEYKKTGTGWGRGDAVWACDNGYGNCTDFHSYFISMSRARGVPSRFIMGLPLPPERGEGVIAGYHCWAEFFTADRGWVPVDISEARKHPELAQYYFGALTEDRVAFTMGRDLKLDPMPASGTANFFIYPLAEADGKPVAAKQAFKYKDA